MPKDLVGILEAAYQVEPGDEQWVAGLCEAVRRCVDQGLGVVGLLYDASNLADVRIWSLTGVGLPERWQEAFVSAAARAGRDALVRMARSEPVNTASSLFGPDHPLTHGFSGAVARGDSMGLNAADPTGLGCLVSALLPAVHHLSARESALWGRVAAHLAAGFRVRRGLQHAASAVEGAEAVLNPDGTVAHAEGAAKKPESLAALRDAALALDRARSRLRKSDPEEAIAIWRGLVAGRWSVVDHFERDGRRFVVARRNDPAASAPRGPLTERESQVIAYAALGHPNKLIAYELGLSESTVATHLAAAGAKLGATSRVELVRAAQRFVTGSPPESTPAARSAPPSEDDSEDGPAFGWSLATA